MQDLYAYVGYDRMLTHKFDSCQAASENNSKIQSQLLPESSHLP